MDKTPKFSHLISDERWGETCLVDNLDQFMRDMEDSMFDARDVRQAYLDACDGYTERGEPIPSDVTEANIVDGWRNELRRALQDVEPVSLPDGRQGWMVANGSVYVETANGLASGVGDWNDLRETTISAILPPIMGNSIIHNDRGNGCGGVGYEASVDVHNEIESEEREDEDLTGVTVGEDPEAWGLAREAFELLHLNPNAIRAVYVGERTDGDNGHQMIYAV